MGTKESRCRAVVLCMSTHGTWKKEKSCWCFWCSLTFAKPHFRAFLHSCCQEHQCKTLFVILIDVDLWENHYIKLTPEERLPCLFICVAAGSILSHVSLTIYVFAHCCSCCLPVPSRCLFAFCVCPSYIIRLFHYEYLNHIIMIDFLSTD